MANDLVKTSNLDRLKSMLSGESVQVQFKNALKDNSGPFVASVIDLYNSDNHLKKCDPGQVVMEALKAATLKLPINKQLGFAYIVPYKDVPQFQLGYKGYIQLAMRTAQYKVLNADVAYEGEYKGKNKLTGEVDLSGERTGDKVVGYFCYMELINGFKKTLYWDLAKVTYHAKRYSKTFNSQNSVWKSNFDEMALKTVVRNLLSHYGILSVEMITALSSDTEDTQTKVENEISQEANSELIDVTSMEIIDEPQASTEPEVAPPDPGF